MDKKQYNDIVENTLKYEQSIDTLTTVRSILVNMGLALPQGDIKTVYETIRTNDYMAWQPCTVQEAYEAVNRGTAVIGINEDRIVVLSANDMDQPTAQSTACLTLKGNALEDSTSDLALYQYANTRSGGDEYSNRDWNSLEEAKSYYGRDYTYTYCGGYYNYYYTFSDGSRLYFHVG